MNYILFEEEIFNDLPLINVNVRLVVESKKETFLDPSMIDSHVSLHDFSIRDHLSFGGCFNSRGWSRKRWDAAGLQETRVNTIAGRKKRVEINFGPEFIEFVTFIALSTPCLAK